MSRYLGLILVSTLCAACGDKSFDAVSAAELTDPHASQCRLDVTAHVNATKVVHTYSTFVCEGSPSDIPATGMAMNLR